jgi:hypothetical protein
VKAITREMRRRRSRWTTSACAAERNAVIAQRDPARFATESGSGLSDQAAADLLAAITPAETAKLNAVAQLVWEAARTKPRTMPISCCARRIPW